MVGRRIRRLKPALTGLFACMANTAIPALAADTDNTGETAIAEFKDIQFVGDAASGH